MNHPKTLVLWTLFLIFISVTISVGLSCYLLFCTRTSMELDDKNDRARLGYYAVATKYEDFDAVFLGTSMTENARCSELDSLYGVRSIKFAMSGSSASEICYIWKYILAYRKPNLYFLDATPGSYSYTANYFRDGFPFEVYEKNILKIILNFNPDIWKIIISLQRHETKHKDRDMIGAWYLTNPCSKKTLAEYLHSNPHPKSMNADTVLLEKNINQLISCIEAASPATVIIYFPPYSILAYAESFEQNIEFKRYFVSKLAQYSNVRVYDFQSESLIVEDLNHYKDCIHYDEKVNTWIIQNTLHDRYRIISENLNIFLDSHRKMIENYDFEAAFHELDEIYRQEIKPDL